MKDKAEPLQFRLAIRYEGQVVNAYMAKPDTMDDKLLLATASRKMLEDDSALREKFIQFGGDMLKSVCNKLLGAEPEFGKRSTPASGMDQMTARTATTADIKVSRALPAVAHELEDLLSEAAGHQVMFTLLCWGNKKSEFTNYITNCKREDVMKGLKEWISLAEAGNPETPLHQRQ